METLHGRRIRFSRLLVHLVGDDLAGGVEEDGKSYGRCSDGVVDIIFSTCTTGLVLGYSYRIKSSMVMISGLRCWSLLRTCARSIHNFHNKTSSLGPWSLRDITIILLATMYGGNQLWSAAMQR
jgi:hypothetical protein